MAANVEASSVALSEIPKKRISSVSYMLKTPNFFTLPERGGTCYAVNSPSFEFADATWQIQFESRESMKAILEAESLSCMRRFAVNMTRLNSETPHHTVFYQITLLDADDRPYREFSDANIYHKNVAILMWVFDNENPSYDRRDTLTLIIQLFSVESTYVDNEQEPRTANGGKFLSRDMKDMLLNGQDHNVTLSVQNKTFRAHQDILRARSDVFQSMLSHDMLEKNNGVIDISDCNPEAFEQFLFYIYTGKIETLDENIAFGLYYAADKYNLARLKEKCSDFMKICLSITNVCRAIELASKHNDEDLLKWSVDYFTIHADDIFPTPEWQLFLQKNITIGNELIIKAFKKSNETRP